MKNNPLMPQSNTPWDFSVWSDNYISEDSPFGYGLIDIDYSPAVYEQGYTPSFPSTGDPEVDANLKRAIESNSSQQVWDYIDSLRGTERDIMAHQLYPFANRDNMYRKYGLSKPVEQKAIEPSSGPVEMGSASSTEMRFSENPFARILGEVFYNLGGGK